MYGLYDLGFCELIQSLVSKVKYKIEPNHKEVQDIETNDVVDLST